MAIARDSNHMKFKVRNRKPMPTGKTLYRPAEYITVESLPSGNWDAFETPELQVIPERPLYMVCDCCLNKSDRLWVRQHYGFCTGFPNAGRNRRDYLAGAWAFCVYCWPLFERGNFDLLTARVATLNPDVSAKRVLLTYEVLAEAVYGDALTWESGQTLAPLRGLQT